MDLGIEVATVEFGGWDTHAGQAPQFVRNLTQLASGLSQFWNDVTRLGVPATVVVMTEFGRRVEANADGGTDHGHGGVMVALGTSIVGGRIHGVWRALYESALDRGDLPVTTDYRQVLAEILSKRRGETDPATVFPGMGTYRPIGIVRA
jgi:uncharacterized protein (DUF1501 family)